MSMIVAGNKVLVSTVIIAKHFETIEIADIVNIRLQFCKPEEFGGAQIGTDENGVLFNKQADRISEPLWTIGFGIGQDGKMLRVNAVIENVFADMKRVTVTCTEEAQST